jgi:hypothetical protein
LRKCQPFKEALSVRSGKKYYVTMTVLLAIITVLIDVYILLSENKTWHILEDGSYFTAETELSLWRRLFGCKTVITVESRVSNVYCMLNIVAGMLLLIEAELKNVTLLCSGLRTTQSTISHLSSVLELAYNILNETNFQLLGMLTAACFFAQDVVIILL